MIGFGIAFFIGIGIALVVLDANESSEVVAWWLDACRFLVGPFDDVFDLERGSVVRVPPETWRSVWNDEPEDAELVIVSKVVPGGSADDAE